eukprot:3692509-Prorocentrum_lima.AAC.1
MHGDRLTLAVGRRGRTGGRGEHGRLDGRAAGQMLLIWIGPQSPRASRVNKRVPTNGGHNRC